ncbi:hypothetical protein NQZ79_g60 [Umbelopsis isabellina]|nr:hypothetical protein NQZ79_g60 [Umbelopsis isabellina]
MKPLTNLQKQRITLNLFVSVALLAVGSVASATFLPCPAYDNAERAAYLEQRRKMKAESGEIQVLVKKRRKARALEEQKALEEPKN